MFILDEVYTLHPLLVDHLLQLLDQQGVVCILAGDPLQVQQRVDPYHLLHAARCSSPWLHPLVFKMPHGVSCMTAVA